MNEDFQSPVKIMDDVAAFSSGAVPVAIKKDQSLWIWPNIQPELYAQYYTQGNPVAVKMLDDVATVSCGDYAIAAIQTDGSLWTWGNNLFGELGIGEMETTNSSEFKKIMSEAVSVSAGNGYMCAVKKDGSLWGWGANMWGNLGNGRVSNHSFMSSREDWGPYPIQTVPIKIMENVAEVHAGGQNETMYTVIVKNDGSLWYCGICPKESIGSIVSGNQKLNLEYFGGEFTIQTVPAKIPGISVALTAYASTQSVLVDGKAVEFQCYALKDTNGNDTNYIKLRDVASVLNGTAATFNVGWDGAVNIETGKGYTPNGSEMNTPFSGDRAYEVNPAETRVDGSPATLEAIVLKDDQGGAYTYYKLRDLGAALGFRVDWSAEKGIFIETK